MPNKLVRVQVEGLKKAVAADINTEGDYIYADVRVQYIYRRNG